MRIPHVRALSLFLLGALPHVARAQRSPIPLTPVAELLGESTREALFSGRIGEQRLTAAIARLDSMAAASERAGDRAESARRFELAATLDSRLRAYLQPGDSASWARVARDRVAKLERAADLYFATGDTIRGARAALQVVPETGSSDPINRVLDAARALPSADKVVTLLVLEQLARSQYMAARADTVLVIACRQFCGAYAASDSLVGALRFELASPDEHGCGCGPVANAIRGLLLRVNGRDPSSTARIYGLQFLGEPGAAADSLLAHGRAPLAAELLFEAAGSNLPGRVGEVLAHSLNHISYLPSDAYDYATRSLALRAPGDSLGRGTSLGMMGMSIGMLGQADSGAVLLRRAESELPRSETGLRALMTRRLAVLSAMRGDSNSAIRLLNESIALRGGDTAVGAPYDRMRVARALVQHGAFTAALREGGRAFAVFSVSGHSADDRAEAATAYAIALREAGRVDSAIAVFEYAAGQQALLASDDEAAESFAAAAEVALEHGRFNVARDLLARATPLARRDPDFVQPAMQRLLNDYGLLALAEKRLADAESFYTEAVSTNVNGNESSEAAHQLEVLAVVRGSASPGTGPKLPAARLWPLAPRIPEADLEPMRGQAPIERPLSLGLTTSALGDAYRRHGLFTRAWTDLHDALALLSAAGDSTALRMARMSMGMLYAQLGVSDSAAAYATLTGSVIPGGRSDAIRTAMRGKGYGESMAAQLRELARARNTGDHLGAARSYGAIGYVQLRLRSPADPARATAYYDSAFSELRLALDTESVAWSALTGRVTRLPDAILVGLSDEFSLLQGEAVLAWLARAKQLGEGPAAFAALAAAEAGRNLSFATLAGGRGVLTSGLAQQVVDGAFFTQPLTEVGRDLVSAAFSYTRKSGVTGHGSISYVQAGDTLVSWFHATGGTGYDRDDIHVFRQRMPADSLAALVTAARASLGVGSAAARDVPPLEPVPTRGVDDDEAGGGGQGVLRALAAVLLPPALRERIHVIAQSRPWDQLPDSAVGFTLFVVPTGPLAAVPFAALPLDSSGTPLGRRMAVRYGASYTTRGVLRDRSTTSFHDLADSSAAARGQWLSRAVVLGDPLMPRVSLPNGTRVTLPQLPAAAREADSVAALVGTRALHGAAASVAAVRARARSATVLHLATHGYAFADPARVGESFVALAPDSTDDGLLRVNDVLRDSSFSLVNADLVVLSACQTALGQFTRSEGTLGLQRAFLASGARSVLVSLWSVSDEATAMLLEAFYRHWLRDPDAPSKPEALRRAQGDVRADKRFAEPKFWAAFQLVGEY